SYSLILLPPNSPLFPYTPLFRSVIPLSWSLDSIGFLTKSVRDAIILASVTFTEAATHDPKSGWRTRPLKLRGLRLGIPRNVLERSEEHTSELQSRFDLVCRLLLE